MHRFLKNILFFALLQAGILSGLLWSSATLPNDFLGLANEKHKRLEALKGPRLLLVGGSNIVMGIDSKILQSELPAFAPANMSLTMALGLPFLLDEVRPQVKSGDVVVVIPEYHLLQAGREVTPANSSFIAEMVLQRPAAIRCVSIAATKAFLDQGGLSLLGQSLRTCRWSTFRERVMSRPKRGNVGPTKNRHANSFNEFGDATYHYSLPAVSFRPMPHEKLTFDRLSDTVSLLNEFYRDCKTKGARVLMAYPPFPSPESKTLAFLTELDAQLRERLEFPIIHHPSEHFFSLDQFYNSYYHLAGAAIPQRSRRLASALSPYLKL